MADASVLEKRYEDAVDKVLKLFNKDELKTEQMTILMSLVNRRDCVAVLPTGFGKSLPYQMLVSVKRELGESDAGKVVVVSPLTALMQDQITTLNRIKDLKAVCLGEDYIEVLQNRDFDYLYMSPEALSNHNCRKKLQELSVATIVVDEFHTMYTWGALDEENEEKAFRKSFRLIGEMRSMFPSANILAVSATCTKDIYKGVAKELGLRKDDTSFIIKSPEKQNIKFSVKKVSHSIEMSMAWLVDALCDLKSDFPRTLIYAETIKQISDIYSFLKLELEDKINCVEMFHSETTEEKKQEILSHLQNEKSPLKVVICSSALGMGVDIKNCNAVILYGAPSNIVDLVQEVGRVGRDGRPSVALLLYTRYHLSKMSKAVKPCFTGSSCRRIGIFEHFISKAEVKKLRTGTHNCCDVCASSCACGNCDEQFIEKLFGQTYEIPEESDSDSDTVDYYYSDTPMEDYESELLSDF